MLKIELVAIDRLNTILALLVAGSMKINLTRRTLLRGIYFFYNGSENSSSVSLVT
jgi:hypothetical protein